MPKIKFMNLGEVIIHQLLRPITGANLWLILNHLSSAKHLLFYNKEIEVVECSELDYEENDGEDIRKCLMNTPVTISAVSQVCKVLQVSTDGYLITCESLKWQNKHYAGFKDEDHRILRLNLVLNIADLFIQQSSVDWLVKTFNPAAQISTTKANTSKHEERFIALESYLKTLNISQLAQNLTLQSMYDNIGAPNKDELWAQLQKININLFAHGFDDFYRQDFFKEGKPNHKLTITVKQGGRPAKK